MDFIVKDSESYEELEEGYKKLPDTVKEFLSTIIINKMNFLISECEDCQSPIEQLMSIALNEQMDKVLPYYTNDFFLGPQKKIESSSTSYRVDFFIAVLFKNKYYGFVVECDGHDFHEKTKEQVKKDKKRERDLIQNGDIVIRFSGSEIVKSPYICAREVTNIIISYLDKG